MTARRRRGGGGCLTALLALVAVLLLGLTAVVGWFYLKDSGWLETRTAVTGGDKGRGIVSGLFRRKPAESAEPEEPAAVPQGPELDRSPPSAPPPPAEMPKPARTEQPSRTVAKPAPSQTVKPQAPAPSQRAPVVKPKAEVRNVPKPSGGGTATGRQTAVDSGPRTVRLYFLRYDDRAGKLVFAPVDRVQAPSVTPLLDTLRLLFAGPSDAEEAADITSAIPGGVRVLGAVVKDGTAVIDLSPEFASGTGREVMLARVYQVVYTATQYETVRSVRILVGGKVVTDLGGEGVDLSRPLGRTLREPVRF